MAKMTFDDDPDVQAMRASMRPAAGSLRWGRVATGVLIVASITFALAYYLPLQRAHGTLNQRFTELQSQLGSANHALAELRSRAKALGEKQQALESQTDQAKQTEKTRADASQAVKSALESKLQKLIAKDQAVVGVAGTQAMAQLALAHVLTAGKLAVSPQGKLTLCSAVSASASNDRPIRVLAIADKKSIPAPLAAKLKTPLQYSMAVAQVVTETLQDKCNVAPARLSATGVPADPPAKLEGKKLGAPRIELWLD